MSMPAVYFSHGQESGPWGTKILAMSETVKALGCRIESIDYQGIADPTDRVDKLIAACRGVREPLVLVGDLDRPNLRYRIVPRTDEVAQIEEVIRRHPGEAVIIGRQYAGRQNS